MSKQTAVEWLTEQIKEYDFSLTDDLYVIEIPVWILKEKIEQAKEMEREQIEDAYQLGFEDGDSNVPIYVDKKEYYNQTYGGKQ
jgi:hypothetical protein